MKTKLFTIWNYEEPYKYKFINKKKNGFLKKEGTTKDV